MAVLWVLTYLVAQHGGNWLGEEQHESNQVMRRWFDSLTPFWQTAVTLLLITWCLIIFSSCFNEK